jgi:UDP-N-acetylmuramoyl-L-alanyl-D-glutamate--2,6-diaminopimelate ligase
VRDSGATYFAADVRTGLNGSSFMLRGAEGEAEVSSSLRGMFNVYNVLGAIATACCLGVELGVAAAAVRDAGRVPGRFEPVDEGQPFAVLVDYAHTPDSLQNVLTAARGLTDRRVHVVFGCGGDRDRGKRPQMGEIATRLADTVIVTSDNPRSEDPESIIREILIGAGAATPWMVDRRDAIFEAVGAAAPGDVVVVAGKGHEQGQEFEGGRTVPFDDATVVREALRSR